MALSVVDGWVALGGLLCQEERFRAVGELVRATWLNRYGTQEAFIGHPGEVGDAVGRLLGPEPRGGQRWAMPVWEWWCGHLRECAWLRERYPGWLAGDGQPDASLAEFDMIDGIAEALRSGGQVGALWSLRPDAAINFARRLHGDPAVRGEVAEAVGIDLETFDERAPEILASAQGLGMFPRTREAANTLRSGDPR